MAGAPHCTAMCSAPCAAVTSGGGRRAGLAFHLARVASYAAVGALAAASVAVLAAWSAWSPALRPLWVMFHAVALALGLWLLLKARQPAWMSRLGRPVVASADGWHSLKGPTKAAVSGGLWAAWPCGLLQSALLVAALGSSPATGAAAMAVFALASAPGLWLGPWALKHLLGGDAARARSRERLAVRVAGAMLIGMSAWALGHGVWHDIAVYCGLA